jgi:hypothetical protein
MLLQKSTYLRASMDEVLSLPEVQQRVENLIASNPEIYETN